MNFVASLVCRNEMGRFLPLVIEHLLTYVDEVRVLDDTSTDGSYQWLQSQDRVHVKRWWGKPFYADESAIRNGLLDWTWEADPTHVLSIDCDEFVADGQELRRRLKSGEIWGLTMREVWKADERHLWTREDGGWKGHVAPIVYAAPKHRNGSWKIAERKLACGRIPIAVQRNMRDVIKTKIDILHFGWTQESLRKERYARYAEHDKGHFHANSHLQSILFEDKKVRLKPLPWPGSLPKYHLMERIA